MPKTRLHFSQRHPFIFGMALLAAAAILLGGVAAAVRIFTNPDSRVFISGQRFGLVHIQGVIFDSRPVNSFISRLEDNPDIPGVLIRVDSPGGVVGPAQEIYSAIKKLAAKKPVVVSMASTAASGGYYVSAPAHKIIANPGTITGSIGVKMEVTNFMGLMDKIGLKQEAFVSGKFKDTPPGNREMRPEEREYLQAVVMDLYDQFVTDVSLSRSMDLNDVKAVADGRILTGRQALEAGLVDELGGFEEALAALKNLCSISKDLPFLEGPTQESSLLDDILTSMNLTSPQDRIGLGYRFLYR